MPERKFVKAFCPVRNRYFLLDLEKFGSEYEVVNFIDINHEEAKIIASQVRQTRFKVHNNLQACAGDGSRIVASSTYPYGKGGCNNGKYNYQCLYCNRMNIDYSRPEGHGQLRKGDVIHLSQGEEVAIGMEDGTALSKILIGAGWDAEIGGHMDVDCSVVMLGQGGSSELICYYNLSDKKRSIVHHGDNLTGIDSDTEGQDDETIDIDLDSVPVCYDRLFFVYNIYSGQMLSSLKNMYFRIADPESGTTLIDYRLHQGSYRDSAVVVAMIRREGDGWKIKAIERNAGTIDVADFVRHCARNF